MPVERGVSSATAAGKIGHRGENRGFTAAGERDAGRLEQDVPEHRHGHVRAGDGLLASLDRVVEQRLVRDRDLRLRVRSALPVDAGAIDWTRDFVYRDGTLVTTFEADGEVLKPILNLRGDPRAHLDANGAVIANGGYYLGPFGIQYSPTPESVDPNADPVKAVHRFTGHERDVNQVSNALDDLDYMHARYMMPRIGRFLSVDPINSADPKVPQSWNRYSYARNNPTTLVDPDGRKVRAADDLALARIRSIVPQRLRSAISVGPDGLIAVDRLATDNANFNDLLELVGVEALVDVVTGSDSGFGEFEFMSREETQRQFGVDPGIDTSFLGHTSDADRSTGTIRVSLSDGTGKAATAPEREHVVTTAHELLGHALLQAQGKSWIHDSGGPVDRKLLEIEERAKGQEREP
jgi:RHS repeat-associated protein